MSRIYDLQVRRHGLLLAGAVLALLLVPTVVDAAIFVHGDLSGTTVDFEDITEESFTDPVPLYGAPFASGDSLLFLPPSFVSSSAGAGGSDVTSGSISLTINAKPGYFISVISLSEFGDWSISGVGTSDTFVSLSGSLDVTDNTITGDTNSDALTTNVPFPQTGAGNGNFMATAGVDLIDLGLIGVTSVTVYFENILETGSEAGTSALIQKKLLGNTTLTVETIIPEPASIVVWSLLGLSLVGGSWLRRRRQAAA
jgi:hypothetical protein